MAFYQRYNLGGQNRHLIRTDCEQFQGDLKAIQRRRRRGVGSLRLNWTQTNEEKCNMFKDGCTPLPSEPPPPRRERDKAQKQRGAWHRDSHLAQSFALPNIAPSDNIRYNQDDHCLH
jgi:hypothetical protein